MGPGPTRATNGSRVRARLVLRARRGALYNSGMPSRVIDGAALAAKIKDEVASRVRALKDRGRNVHLTAVLVGSTHAGELYANRQRQACAAVGIDYELRTLQGDADGKTVAATIQSLNRDPSVSGIMLHLPLPRGLDATELQYQIDPVKDVEGVNPANIGYVVYGHTLIAPCTALAVIELIKSTGVAIRGAEAVVVGASEIAGKPIALLLAEQMATVTLCHIATKDLTLHTARAEILVVAVGKPNLIGADHVKAGAVVIDVGINRLTLVDGTKKTVGDVDFDAVRAKAAHITPVPGGVGPMTTRRDRCRRPLSQRTATRGDVPWVVADGRHRGCAVSPRRRLLRRRTRGPAAAQEFSRDNSSGPSEDRALQAADALHTRVGVRAVAGPAAGGRPLRQSRHDDHARLRRGPA